MYILFFFAIKVKLKGPGHFEGQLMALGLVLNQQFQLFSLLVTCAMMLYQLPQSHSYWRLFVTQQTYVQFPLFVHISKIIFLSYFYLKYCAV